MSHPPWFPDYRKVYQCLLGVANSPEASYAAHLADGFAVFKRAQDAATAAAKSGSNLPLSRAPASYKGSVSEYGPTCVRVSEILGLHAAQSLLLLRRWAQAQGLKPSKGWAASAEQTRDICSYYLSQRWHLSCCLKLAVEAQQQASLHSVPGPLQATAAALDMPALLASLLATSTGSLQVLVRTTSFDLGRTKAADGVLSMSQAPNGLAWTDYLSRELCSALISTLKLLEQHKAETAAVLIFTRSLLDSIAQSAPNVLDDSASLLALAMRLALFITLDAMPCKRVLAALAAPHAAAAVSAIQQDTQELIQPLLADVVAAAASVSSPALVPLLLPLSALHVLLSPEGAAPEAAADAAVAAEDLGGLETLRKLLCHDGLRHGEEQRLVAGPLFYALGAVCTAFDMRPTALAQSVLLDLLEVLDVMLCENEQLVWLIWEHEPATAFIWRLLDAAVPLFPVFTTPYVSLLASLCASTRGAFLAMRTLRDLRTCTAYFDAESSQRTLAVSGEDARILHDRDPVVLSLVDKVGPMERTGTVVPLPRLAEGLLTGSCTLVQLRLAEGRTHGSAGLSLVALEMWDRAARLRHVCHTRTDVDMLPSIVRTLGVCCRLVARLLGNCRWSVYSLMHTPAPGHASAAERLLAALQSVLTSLASAPASLPPSELTASRAHELVEAAADALTALRSIAAALPSKVLEVLLRVSPEGFRSEGGTRGVYAGTSAGGPGEWGANVLHGVHAYLEARCGNFQASVAYVRLLAQLSAHTGDGGELAVRLTDLVWGVVGGLGCQHGRWPWRCAADCWSLTEAVLNLVVVELREQHAVRGPEGPARHARRTQFVHGLLQQDLLSQLLRATCTPPPQEVQLAEDFLSAVRARTRAAAAAHMELATAVVAAVTQLAPHLTPLARTVYFESGSGCTFAALIMSYVARCAEWGGVAGGGGGGTSVHLRCVAALLQLLQSDGQAGGSINTASSLRPFVQASSSQEDAMRQLVQCVAAPLDLRGVAGTEAAAGAAAAILSCALDLHPSLAKLLMLPSGLEESSGGPSDAGASRTGAAAGSGPAKPGGAGKQRSYSCLDSIWASLSLLSAGGTPSATLASGCHVLSTLPALQRKGLAPAAPAALLTKQPAFWQTLHTILQARCSEALPEAAPAPRPSGSPGHAQHPKGLAPRPAQLPSRELPVLISILETSCLALHAAPAATGGELVATGRTSRAVTSGGGEAEGSVASGDGEASLAGGVPAARGAAGAAVDGRLLELVEGLVAVGSEDEPGPLAWCMRACRGDLVLGDQATAREALRNVGAVAALAVWKNMFVGSVSSTVKQDCVAMARELDRAMQPLEPLMAAVPDGCKAQVLDASLACMMERPNWQRLSAGLAGHVQRCVSVVRASSAHVPVLSRLLHAPSCLRPPPYEARFAPTFSPHAWDDLLDALSIPVDVLQTATLPVVSYVRDGLAAAAAAAAAPPRAVAAAAAVAELAQVAAQGSAAAEVAHRCLQPRLARHLLTLARITWTAAADAAFTDAGGLSGPSLSSMSHPLAAGSPWRSAEAHSADEPGGNADWLPVALTVRAGVGICMEMVVSWLAVARMCVAGWRDEVDCGERGLPAAREPSFETLLGAAATGEAVGDGDPQDVATCAQQVHSMTMVLAADILSRLQGVQDRISAMPNGPPSALGEDASPNGAAGWPGSECSRVLKGCLQLMMQVHGLAESLLPAQPASAGDGRPAAEPRAGSPAPASLEGTYRLMMQAAVHLHAFALAAADPPHQPLALSVLLALMTTATDGPTGRGPVVPPEQVLALMPAQDLLAVARGAVTEASAGGGAAELHTLLAGNASAHLALALLQRLCAACAAGFSGPQVSALGEALTDIVFNLNRMQSVAEREGGLATPPAAVVAETQAAPMSQVPRSAAEVDTAAVIQALTPAAPAAGAATARVTALVPHRHARPGGGDGGTATIAAAAASEPPGGHKGAWGYRPSGARCCVHRLRLEALHTLCILLSNGAGPSDLAATAMSALVTDLCVPLRRVARLFSDRDDVTQPRMLTVALLDDSTAALYLLSLLTQHSGVWLLHAPLSLPDLRRCLCALLTCVGKLPFTREAVRGLSCAPVDPSEQQLADEATGKAAEPLLALNRAWFWVTCACTTRRDSDADLPAWARLHTSLSPALRSPDHIYGSSSLRRASSTTPRSPQRGSPHLSPPGTPGRGRSASPSASPGPIVAHLSASSLPADDVDTHRHGERLAAGVYALARLALRLLTAVAPTRAAEEVHLLDPASWPDAETLLGLQRQSLMVAWQLVQQAGLRGDNSPAARRLRKAMIHGHLEILTLTEQLVVEFRGNAEFRFKSAHTRAVKDAVASLDSLFGYGE